MLSNWRNRPRPVEKSAEQGMQCLSPVSLLLAVPIWFWTSPSRRRKLQAGQGEKIVDRDINPDFHFSFGCANHRVASDAFIYEGWKALKALRRSIPHG